ncbi:MAG: hypothetical protein COB50_00245 [Thiotrichales bacterium]|nr:MAG: hypothetical protein COB50_00245 [Thiotrichales bacterium]
MGFFKKTAKTLKRATWLPAVKEQTGFIKKLFAGVFKTQSTTATDKFSDLSKLGINDKKVKEAKESFGKLLAIFLVGALLLCLYGILLLTREHYMPSIIAFAVAVLCVSQAFKYHFWLMQIKKQKLGCTFKDWVEYTFRIKAK